MLHCHISSGSLWYLTRAWPDLSSLVVREAPLAGIGTSGVAAVAGLSRLRVLGLTVEQHADVSSLGDLISLRWVQQRGGLQQPKAWLQHHHVVASLGF